MLFTWVGLTHVSFLFPTQRFLFFPWLTVVVCPPSAHHQYTHPSSHHTPILNPNCCGFTHFQTAQAKPSQAKPSKPHGCLTNSWPQHARKQKKSSATSRTARPVSLTHIHTAHLHLHMRAHACVQARWQPAASITSPNSYSRDGTCNLHTALHEPRSEIIHVARASRRRISAGQ